MASESVHVIDLGAASYLTALDAQRECVETLQTARLAGDEAAARQTTLLLVEHSPAVITLGRRGKAGDILVSREQLATRNIEVHESARGGEVTYHGPGQLVAYVIRDVSVAGRSLRQHVSQLEETVIRTLASFEIEATRREGKGLTGVWVPGEGAAGQQGASMEKIAAIGVAVRHWVTYHGLALNVATDLDAFSLIVPCGLASNRVTSMTKASRQPQTLAKVKPAFIQAIQDVFGECV